MENDNRKKILFVDDDLNLLNGLRRMLRRMSEEWDMKFVSSGSVALEELNENDYDMLVSDMKMPAMDGIQLLNTVKERYPGIIRFILSGHADQEMIVSAVGPTHQFISKPCEPEVMIQIISKAFRLRTHVFSEKITSIITDSSILPTLPELYQRLRKLLQSPDSPLKNVAEVISQDVSMTAQILHLVNSAFFGMPRKIDSIEQAVAMLGIDAVSSIVLASGLFKEFSEKKIEEFQIRNLYSHSILTGVFAEKLAQYFLKDRKAADEAMLAGMIHDVGQLFFIENKPEEWKQALERHNSEDIPLHEAEEASLGLTHAEVGAYILGLWGLSDNIVEAVAWHHQPLKAESNTFDTLAAVHIGNGMEHQCLTLIKNGLDMEYINKLGLQDQVSDFKIICGITDNTEILKGKLQ